MDKSKETTKVVKKKSVDLESTKSLAIFKTDADKYGRDITAMSDFFDGYVQQMSLLLREQAKKEIVSDIPIADIKQIL